MFAGFFRPKTVLSQHMPQPVTITFRDQTTGKINDLLIDEGQPSAPSQNLLAYLAGALVNYKEEGIELTPSVVLCDNIQEVLRIFPGALSHRVGTAPLDPSSGPMVLKHCAPLSGRHWFIFIERVANDTMNYGVFTYFRLPTAIPLHEAITINTNQFCILVRKTSPNTIEIRGAKGSVLTFNIFHHARSDTIDHTYREVHTRVLCARRRRGNAQRLQCLFYPCDRGSADLIAWNDINMWARS